MMKPFGHGVFFDKGFVIRNISLRYIIIQVNY